MAVRFLKRLPTFPEPGLTSYLPESSSWQAPLFAPQGTRPRGPFQATLTGCLLCLCTAPPLSEDGKRPTPYLANDYFSTAGIASLQRYSLLESQLMLPAMTTTVTRSHSARDSRFLSPKFKATMTHQRPCEETSDDTRR